MGNKSSSPASKTKTLQNVFALTGKISSPDVFSIKNDKTGDIFKVKNAGIKFTLLAIQNEAEGQNLLAHFGLLCQDNKFVSPSGVSFDYCLVHRLGGTVQVAFSNNCGELYNCLRAVFGESGNGLTVTKIPIGSVVKVASTYVDMIKKEMSLKFKIKMNDPSKETNCMAFICRVLTTLGLEGSFPECNSLKKTLVTDSWPEELADITCKFLSFLLGREKVCNDKYAISVLNSFIPKEAIEAFSNILREYLPTMV